jgi:murein DD-endopeptidase MepM/ murein hydrolase activator NlpD
MRYSFFLLLFSVTGISQTDYPKSDFRSPLDIPLFLSGNFGELRSNHFHAGLDFKTQQKEGLNVYAVADGYVSRIKISNFGYGKAIYITHQNGFTTVYGHLSKANTILQNYIEAIQYREQSYEFEVFPEPTELLVLQGDVIAFSGNSGGSGGPHLHFEIRDSKTEKIINPMYFDFDTKVLDSKPPILAGLYAYPIGENAQVNGSQVPISIHASLQNDGSYITEKVVTSGKIGFGINAYDAYDFSYSKNGLFKVQTFTNGKPLFGYQFDTFSFEESKLINGLLDYPRFVETGVRIQKLFLQNPYFFSPLQYDKSNGLLDVSPNLSTSFRIEISDFKNEAVVINVPIFYGNLPLKNLKSVKKTNYFLKTKTDNNYQKDNISVFVPANSFYEDTYLNFEVNNDTLTFQDETFALQNNIAITFEDTKSSEAERKKMFIANLDNKKIKFIFTKQKGNEFIAYTKNLGKFVLSSDTIAPKIIPINIKKGSLLLKETNIKFQISDEGSGIDQINGFLNGKWVLFEYDYKIKRIVHNFRPEFLVDGKNDLKIVVSDNVGNSAIFDIYFYRKKQL